MYWQAGPPGARIIRHVCLSEVSVSALQNLRKRLEPQVRWAFHLYWRLARGMTLGVRGVVFDGGNRVFLVRHSYVSGWHLPGGGVEVGETFLDALVRELMEEGRIELTGEAALHGVFFNSYARLPERFFARLSPTPVAKPSIWYPRLLGVRRKPTTGSFS